MEPRDTESLERLLPGDGELQRLWEEHRALEEELTRLDVLRVLTPEEEIRRKEIQKKKLAGRDQIQGILDRHR